MSLIVEAIARTEPAYQRWLASRPDDLLLDGGVLLYGQRSVAERNTTFEVARYAPGYLLIGDDSGGRGFLINTTSAVGPVFQVDLGSPHEDDFEQISPSFDAWVSTGFAAPGAGGGYRARINGVDLFVRRHGDPALPPLIVVHGGPTWDHSYLAPAVERLSDVAHVVMFDLRGCGRSARIRPLGPLTVDDLRPELLADDVAGLVDHLGVERADVLGFSYGGMIAMRAVDRHPDRVRRLILASTTAYRDGWSAELDADPEYRRRGDLRGPVRFDDPALVGPQAPDGALSRAMANASAPRDVWRLDRLDDWDRVLDRVEFSSDWNAPFFAGDLPPAAPEDPPRVLRRWGGPVLIAQGVHEMTFPASLARRLHAEVPTSTLALVPDAAHMAHFDNPTAWLTAVRTFLAR